MAWHSLTHTQYILRYLALVFVFCVYLFYILFSCASPGLSLFLYLFLLMSLRPPAVCHIEHISTRKWQKNLTHNRTDTIKMKDESCAIAIKAAKRQQTKRDTQNAKLPTATFKFVGRNLCMRFGHYTQEKTPTQFSFKSRKQM